MSNGEEEGRLRNVLSPWSEVLIIVSMVRVCDNMVFLIKKNSPILLSINEASECYHDENGGFYKTKSVKITTFSS